MADPGASIAVTVNSEAPTSARMNGSARSNDRHRVPQGQRPPKQASEGEIRTTRTSLAAHPQQE